MTQTQQPIPLSPVPPIPLPLEGSHRLNFLYSSIQNAQAVVQATDVKLNILVAILLLPLTRLDLLVAHLTGRFAAAGAWGLAAMAPLAAAVAGAWLASVFFTLRGLVAIRNPVDSIRSARGSDVKGCFYNAGLYPHDRWHGVGQSTRTLEEQIALYPQDLEGLVRELAWEQMKLTYIREVKMRRQRLAYGCAMAAIVLVIVLWVVSLGV